MVTDQFGQLKAHHVKYVFAIAIIDKVVDILLYTVLYKKYVTIIAVCVDLYLNIPLLHCFR